MTAPVAIGSAERRAHTQMEMRFAVSLRACDACGAPLRSLFPPRGSPLGAWKNLELTGSGDRWMFSGACPSCRTKLAFAFYTHGHPATTTHSGPWRELGDTRPAVILEPSQLRAELERLKALITPRAPERLTPPERRQHDEALERAIICAVALVKLAPGDAGLAAERARLVALAVQPTIPMAAALFDPAGPPPTVGAFERALGIRFEDAHLVACAEGELKLGPPLPAPLGEVVVKWIVPSDPPRTLEELRDKTLAKGWYVKLSEGRATMSGALRERFGAPRELSRYLQYDVPGGSFVLTWLAADDDSCVLALAKPPAPNPDAARISAELHRKRAQNAADLAEAEREAHASGKEPLDYGYLARRYGAHDEAATRISYYIFHPEIRTLDEFGALLEELRPWEDCR